MIRFSRQRQAILDLVLNSNNHPTADYIYAKLKKDFPELSLGTVYRNLSQLSDNGLIKKVSMSNKSDRFDRNLERHSHIICSNCGDVYDIDTSSIDDIISNIPTDANISIKSYDIRFDGICNKCENEENN